MRNILLIFIASTLLLACSNSADQLKHDELVKMMQKAYDDSVHNAEQLKITNTANAQSKAVSFQRKINACNNSLLYLRTNNIILQEHYNDDKGFHFLRTLSDKEKTLYADELKIQNMTNAIEIMVLEKSRFNDSLLKYQALAN